MYLVWNSLFNKTFLCNFCLLLHEAGLGVQIEKAKFAHTLCSPQCLALHSVYTFSADCTEVYRYLVPPWPQYCQPITEEHRVICFALIGPIDDLKEGELPYVDHVPS